jgi:hypothetical protein
MAKGKINCVEGWCWPTLAISHPSQNPAVASCEAPQAASGAPSHPRNLAAPFIRGRGCEGGRDASEKINGENYDKSENTDLNAPGLFDFPEPLVRKKLTPAPVDEDDLSDILG